MKITRSYLLFLSFILCVAWALPSHAQTTSDGTGLKVSASVDIVGKVGDAGLGSKDRLEVREAELMVYSPVDHLFHGMLNMAAHVGADGAFFEIHEAYIGSTKLIPRSRFVLGHFPLSIGRLNWTHRHEWPFVSAPKVQANFFDPEAVFDTGIEFATLLPTPFYWDLLVGVTNGWTFGHSHTLGERPDIPNHYIRSVHYFDLPHKGGMQLGLNYLGRRNDAGTHFHFPGLDATVKWRRGKRLLFLLQSEIWARMLNPKGGSLETTLGGYIFPQYGFTSQWYFGVRGDFFTVLDLKQATGGRVSNGTYAAVPTLTWKPSEFAALRMAYTFEYDKPGAAPKEIKHGFEFQATFNIGAHPAHDF